MKYDHGTIGFCLVGAGAIAARHAAALSEIPGCSLEWVIGREADAANDFATQWQFRRHGIDLAEALRDSNVQVVLIASPSQLHAEQASLCLRGHKDVVVEIPAALKLSDATRLLELSGAVNRRAFVCHTLRAAAGLREIRCRVRSGEACVSQVAGFFGIPRRENQGATGRRNWIDNLLWHHGCHQIDASLWALGIPAVEAVAGAVGKLHPQFQMAMDVGLLLRTSEQQIVTQSLSYNVGQPVWELRFVTDDDVFTLNESGLFSERGEKLCDGTTSNDVTLQDRAIVESLRTARPCDFDLETVIPMIAVLDRIQHAIQGEETSDLLGWAPRNLSMP